MSRLKRYSGKAAIFLAAAVVWSSLFSAGYGMAADQLKVSEKEYSLTVEDVPDGVESKVYAKLHDSSLNAEEYMLSLFDGLDAEIAMEEALSAAGEDTADIDFQAMEITLYQADEEGDFYPTDELGGITVICPVPENYVERAEELQVVAIGGNGKLERLNSTLVSVSGITCVKFDLSKAQVYAFLVKEGGKLTAGTVPTATPVPGGAKPTPTKAASTPTPTKAASTPAPTKAAAGTATPEPTKAAGKPTPVPTKAASTPAPTKAALAPTKAASTTTKATQAPTKAAANAASPTKAGGNISGNVTSGMKDKTPQTGDGFCREGYLILLGAGVAAFGGILLVYMKKK